MMAGTHYYIAHAAMMAGTHYYRALAVMMAEPFTIEQIQ